MENLDFKNYLYIRGHFHESEKTTYIRGKYLQIMNLRKV
jgi:hypothetical protein